MSVSRGQAVTSHLDTGRAGNGCHACTTLTQPCVGNAGGRLARDRRRRRRRCRRFFSRSISTACSTTSQASTPHPPSLASRRSWPQRRRHLHRPLRARSPAFKTRTWTPSHSWMPSTTTQLCERVLLTAPLINHHMFKRRCLRPHASSRLRRRPPLRLRQHGPAHHRRHRLCQQRRVPMLRCRWQCLGRRHRQLRPSSPALRQGSHLCLRRGLPGRQHRLRLQRHLPAARAHQLPPRPPLRLQAWSGQGRPS